jgi:hypothetical protein
MGEAQGSQAEEDDIGSRAQADRGGAESKVGEGEEVEEVEEVGEP